MRLLILITLLISSVSVQAQKFETRDYDWKKDPKRYKLKDSEQKDPAVIVYFNNIEENAYNKEKTTVSRLMTIHRIIRVNSDDAIDAHNKVSIYVGPSEELVEIKARTISPSGKVVNFDKSKIKDVSESEDKNYKIFAIEGVEKGSEIEYLYQVKKSFSIYGRDIFQYSIPILEADFLLITPENLKFDFKGYNGFPEVKDTTYNEKRYISAKIKNIPALPDEQFSAVMANKMRVEYKLAYNTSKNSGRLYTWADAAQTIYSNFHGFSTKEDKAAAKYFKKVGIKSSDPLDKKVHKIDQFIKKNIYIKKELPGNTLDHIIDNKYASESGVIRLYTKFFTLADIDYQIVFTTNRNQFRFDGTFDTWNYLNETLFYFPKSDKYLLPTSYEYQYGLIPSEFTYNDGLFIKKVTIGSLETALHEIRRIPAPDHKVSYDNMLVDISFTKNLEKNEISIKRSLAGYKAANIYSIFPLLQPDVKEEIVKELITYMVPDADFTEIKLVNKDFNIPFTDTAMVITAKAKSEHLIENAGKKIFLKVGEVIGEQMEMYQDQERKTEVENHYNRTYHRIIRITIPEGYVVKNPEALTMNVICEDEGDKVFVFTSTYTQKGNVLEVDVMEYYKRITFPVERYEEYRKVINAAADFNKIKLILEPK